MSTDPETKRRERADSTRNRDKIVAVARDAFARADAAGEPLSMNEIARLADVGVATLYRHFPTRDDLAGAVYEAKLDELTREAAQRAAGQSGHEQCRQWVDAFAAMMLSKRGMMDTLRAASTTATPMTVSARRRIAVVLEGFLVVGRADGSFRDDVDAEDLTTAVLALLATAGPGENGDRARRLLGVFLDGVGPSMKHAPRAK